jgi:hypothetical protein
MAVMVRATSGERTSCTSGCASSSSAPNHVRIDADAVIGENGERGDVLEKLHVRGAERQWQIGRERRGDAEPFRHIHDGIDADFFREFYGGNVARARQSPAKRDGPFKFFVVIARGVGLATTNRGKRQIDDGVEGRRPSFQRVGVDIHLERAADLAEGLRRAVEFGILKTISANHGLDFAGGIVDGEKCALRAGLLFELNAHGIVAQFLDGQLYEVAHF